MPRGCTCQSARVFCATCYNREYQKQWKLKHPEKAKAIRKKSDIKRALAVKEYRDAYNRERRDPQRRAGYRAYYETLTAWDYRTQFPIFWMMLEASKAFCRRK